MKNNSVFFYGTQYYRPPNPSREQHAFHLRQIKEDLGFNIVKVFLEWSYVHEAPDKFDFAEIDEIFDLCDSLDLNVLIQTRLESAPFWLEKAHPEARYVSANGTAVELGPNGNTQCGGYPGLCLHHEPVRREAEKFLGILAAHFKNRKSLIGYDCWNEPHMEPAWLDTPWLNMGDRLFCYCDATKQAFRRWLCGKYGTIAGLNGLWTRKYGNWEEINPPNRPGHYADWLDWARFMFDNQKELMQWRVNAIKKQDGKHFVMSHSGAVPPFLPRANAFINNWALAEPADLWGTSMAPRYMNWSFAESAGILELTRSAAGDKDFWISELTGGSGNVGGFFKSAMTRPKDIRVWNWLGVVYGARGIVYWCYLTESTGLEAGSYGLVRLDGEKTKRAEEAALQAGLIQKYDAVIRSGSVRTDVAILYDPDNSSLLFAMEGTDQLYGNSHIGYYTCLWKNDLFARYVTYDQIEKIEEKILIVPMCLTLDQATAQKICAFVRKGGVLIAEARMGLFDENGYLQPVLPSFGLAQAAGIREGEAFCSDPDNHPRINNSENAGWGEEIYEGPEVSMTWPSDVKFRARGYLSPLEVEDADCIGSWKDVGLAAHHSYGNGEVYYFGTYIGLSLFEREEGAQRLLSSILQKHAKPRIKGNGLRPRFIGNEKEGILVVFNDEKTLPRRDLITLPSGLNCARNIFTGKNVTVNEDGALNVIVDPEDAAVFYLY